MDTYNLTKFQTNTIIITPPQIALTELARALLLQFLWKFYKSSQKDPHFNNKQIYLFVFQLNKFLYNAI
jgi:hypothetical protein